MECGLSKGKYLHMRCVALILNLAVKDGLKDIGKSILKILALVKYVRFSPVDSTNMEWKQVASFFPFLKTFYDTTLKLLSSCYLTCNACVNDHIMYTAWTFSAMGNVPMP